jgi:PTS system nitrogen regulatory IIA component
LARERLGSTGLGHGVALPHARVKNCTEAVGAYVHTTEGVDFDALDSEPVDVFFALLVPEDSTEDHLQTLANLAQRFSDAELVERLRTSSKADQVLNILTE